MRNTVTLFGNDRSKLQALASRITVQKTGTPQSNIAAVAANHKLYGVGNAARKYCRFKKIASDKAGMQNAVNAISGGLEGESSDFVEQIAASYERDLLHGVPFGDQPTWAGNYEIVFADLRAVAATVKQEILPQ